MLGRDASRRVAGISSAALAALLQPTHWPGNVRELRERASSAPWCSRPRAAPSPPMHVLLPEDATPTRWPPTATRAIDFEAQYFGQLSRATGGNVSLVAKMAKRTRTQVYETLRRLDIDPSQFRVFDAVERS